MKKFFYFLPLAAVAFASCSNDEPLVAENPETPEEIKVFDTDCAMVSINIMAADNGSRTRVGADGTKNDYKFGSADENNVTSIDFYFYDAAGDYVTAYLNATITNNDWTEGDKNNNQYVERIGNAKIVLTDLLGTNYPSYVIAILNPIWNSNPQPNSKYDVETKLKTSLTEAHKVLLGKESTWTVANNVAKDFMMTSVTTDENAPDFHYFATPINESNFAIQTGNQGQDWPEGIEPKPVDMYVERLAAKVELKFGDVGGTYNADKGTYLIKLPESYAVDGSTGTDLYVKLQGWGINGIEKENYYFKHLAESNSFITYDGWDFSGTNRCYWAVSPTYGESNYPNSFGEVVENGNATGNLNADKEFLRYISWNDVKNNKLKENGKNFTYIPENTERASNTWISATNTVLDAALSEVLIAAQITDADGNPVELYQISETYYTKEGVINYLLTAAGAHIWKEDGTTEDGSKKYKNIEPEDVDVVYGYDGTFSLKVTNTTETYYEDNEGKVAYANSIKVEDYINAFLPNRQTFAYIDGMMYYNIPIQHLRRVNGKVDGSKTGTYGVVRNHWYEVTVTGVKKLGRAVYRPDEHIIPNTDDTRYMIGSSIKINSWRMVRQDIEL